MPNSNLLSKPILDAGRANSTTALKMFTKTSTAKKPGGYQGHPAGEHRMVPVSRRSIWVEMKSLKAIQELFSIRQPLLMYVYKSDFYVCANERKRETERLAFRE